MQQLNPGERVVYYDEGPMATVSVVKNNFGFNTINIDGVGVAGTDPLLQTDQKSLAHLPMLLAENPRRVLTVGFGSGGASYSYLLHDRLEKGPLRRDLPGGPAGGALPDRRQPRLLEEARPSLQVDLRRRAQLPAPHPGDLRRHRDGLHRSAIQVQRQSLRRRVFPLLARAPAPRRNGRGLDASGRALPDMFKLALRTFHVVFPEMAVFFMDNEPTHYIFLIGWRDRMAIDFERMRERLQEPDVRADLAELSLDDPIKILSTWITGGEPLRAYLAGKALNTENFPYLEFGSPRYGYADRPILDNLASLMAIHNSPRRFLSPGGAGGNPLAALDRYERALPKIIEGHAHYRNLEIEEATRSIWRRWRSHRRTRASLAS